jgi:Holliday junction resolvase RusA-like endonuclease
MKLRKCDWYDFDDKGRLTLRITLDMPPSDNKLYWNNPWGGRTRTRVATAYHNAARAVIGRLMATTRCGDFAQNVPYRIALYLFFEEVENSGWKKGRAATRYKKCDAGNRQKLVIDAVTDAVGVDDRHIFKEEINKRCDPEDPRIVVVLRERLPRK